MPVSLSDLVDLIWSTSTRGFATAQVLVSGDGGFLMGLSDLESLIGAAGSAVVVIYIDAAY